MNISLAIMAHPKRRAAAEALLDQLTDYPFTESAVIYDIGNNEWETGKRALLQGVGKGDWHVVIQDDAILTPRFYQNIKRAIMALSERALISLYAGTARPIPDRVKNAIDKAPDGSWLAFHQLMWGVGIVIPTDHIEPMLEFVEDIGLQYDNKVGEFYARNGLLVYYTVPSLVDHDDAVDTLVPGHGRDISPEPRRAHRLATGLIEWTSRKTPI